MHVGFCELILMFIGEVVGMLCEVLDGEVAGLLVGD